MKEYESNLELEPISEEEDIIDLLDLARMLWQKKWILIIGFIAGVVLAAAGTKLFITPQYQSKSIIYIYTKTTSVTSLTDLQIGSQLTVDFKTIATTREVIERAIADLGLNLSYESMVKKVTVTNPSNSRMLVITVRDSDPAMAAEMSNTLANELRKRIAEVMNTDEPSVVEKAVPAKNPMSPSLKKNAVLGGVAVFVVIVLILIVIYLMDDTVKTEEDVTKYLNHTVLAVFPKDSAMSKSRSRSTNSVLPHKNA